MYSKCLLWYTFFMLEFGIFFFIILVFSIVLHEVSHGFAALSRGDTTARDAGRLTLNPIAHIDLLGSIIVPGFLLLFPSGFIFGWAKPVPYNPYNMKGRYDEAFVAAAGSLSNILLAIIFAILIRLNLFSNPIEGFFLSIIYINLFLGLLNLIPIPGFDGFRVLSSLFPRIRDRLYSIFNPILGANNYIVVFLALLVFVLLLADLLVALVKFLSFILTGIHI